MFRLWLIRHGDSINDNLTPKGVEQMRLAAERFKRLWDGARVHLIHSPTGRTRSSADVFSQYSGLESEVCADLSIEHYHDREQQRRFAEEIACVRDPHVVLIAHDETRRLCKEIVLHRFRRTDKTLPVPLGGILRFVETHGYELV